MGLRFTIEVLHEHRAGDDQRVTSWRITRGYRSCRLPLWHRAGTSPGHPLKPRTLGLPYPNRRGVQTVIGRELARPAAMAVAPERRIRAGTGTHDDKSGS